MGMVQGSFAKNTFLGIIPPRKVYSGERLPITLIPPPPPLKKKNIFYNFWNQIAQNFFNASNPMKWVFKMLLKPDSFPKIALWSRDSSTKILAEKQKHITQKSSLPTTVPTLYFLYVKPHTRV